MSRKKMTTDRENPEWTKADFRRAKRASALPAVVLKAFPKRRGAQKLPTKVAISIRLSSEVVAHFKAGGPGWQSRIDATLKKAAGL
jgi:uncharacterized protein (DUF4415 family)